MASSSGATCGSESQSGAILVVTMLATLVLLGLGLVVIWVGASQTRIGGNLNRRQEALYAAESGLSRARAVLAATASWTAHTETGCGGADSATKGRVLCDPGMTTPQQYVQVAVAPFPGPARRTSATSSMCATTTPRGTRTWPRSSAREGQRPAGGGARRGTAADG